MLPDQHVAGDSRSRDRTAVSGKPKAGFTYASWSSGSRTLTDVANCHLHDQLGLFWQHHLRYKVLDVGSLSAASLSTPLQLMHRGA